MFDTLSCTNISAYRYTMHIVKLNATTSTNTYLKEYTRELDYKDDILVWAHAQVEGRGQRGAIWESEPGKNLTCSVFKRVEGYRADRTFYMTMAASLMVVETLEHFGVRQLTVKWPNDIMAGSRKICGILIETVIRDGLYGVILGVGINVNQQAFERAPRATSVLLETGRVTDLSEVLDYFVKSFYKYAELVSRFDFTNLHQLYEKQLFRKGKVSTFELPGGKRITGIIRGVSKNGKLILQLEDELLKEFDLKEIKLLY
mgnify:CR=1 FL=1